MKISFQDHTQENKVDAARGGRTEQYNKTPGAGKASQASGAVYDAGSLGEHDRMWAAGAGREKRSLTQLQQEAAQTDVSVQQDYMTVMSNTMSEEDYAELEKEGFRFEGLDPEEAVTIVDKIKAELVRSGKAVAGYTDDLDLDTLAAAVGSTVLAQTIADSFAQADIPLTKENLDSVTRAWDMAARLNPPTEGEYHYLMDNGLEAEIWSFYLAQSSGAAGAAGGAPQTGGSPRYFAEEIPGQSAGHSARYYAQSAETAAWAEGVPQDQLQRFMEQSGIPVNEENLEAARWLMDQGLPVTEENLDRLHGFQEVSFPVTEEAFARAAAAAIAQGRDPVHGNLSEQENLYRKAVETEEHYRRLYQEQEAFRGTNPQEAEKWLRDAENITARKQLEEIRLRMTAEVNVKLLKSGFAIDTAPMEELLAALRKAEAEIANKYFPQDEAAVAKYQRYHETASVVEELPYLPARVLGHWSIREEEGTLSQFHAEGKAHREAYEKAQESYEALMTAPRKDMGDSIRKAFANVDDILQDLKAELSEENRRAARILGYNGMEMTAENIERVKAADEQVRSVIEKMTPAATLKMIRDGVNPLESSFTQLAEYLEAQETDYSESAESYSRFLYGLEKNHNITEAERESYIGIYRLIHQIEHSDGAAVGALVNVGAELHFSNLLSAVRSGRFKGMDVAVNDAFGAVAERIQKGEGIDSQIAKAFVAQAKEMLTEVSYTEEGAAEYRHEELEQLRAAAHADPDGALLLQRGEVPANAGNLLAAQALLHDFGTPFRRYEEKTGKQEETFGELWEKLDSEDSFKEEYGSMLETMQDTVERMSMEDASGYVDVRSYRMLHKQLAVMQALPAAEEYIFPMYIGEELSKVHLTIEKGAAEEASVHIAAELGPEEHVEAHFRLEGGRLDGFLVGNTAEEVTKLQKAADIFTELIGREDSNDYEIAELPVVNSASRTDAGGMKSGGRIGMDAGNLQSGKAASSQELYHIAKVFLQSLKQ